MSFSSSLSDFDTPVYRSVDLGHHAAPASSSSNTFGGFYEPEQHGHEEPLFSSSDVSCHGLSSSSFTAAPAYAHTSGSGSGSKSLGSLLPMSLCPVFTAALEDSEAVAIASPASPTAASSSSLPVCPVYVEPWSSFTTSSCDALSAMRDALVSLRIDHTLHHHTIDGDAVLPDGSAFCSFRVSLFAAAAAGYVLEFQRRAGSAQVFHSMLRAVVKQAPCVCIPLHATTDVPSRDATEATWGTELVGEEVVVADAVLLDSLCSLAVETAPLATQREVACSVAALSTHDCNHAALLAHAAVAATLQRWLAAADECMLRSAALALSHLCVSSEAHGVAARALVCKQAPAMVQRCFHEEKHSSSSPMSSSPSSSSSSSSSSSAACGLTALRHVSRALALCALHSDSAAALASALGSLPCELRRALLQLRAHADASVRSHAAMLPSL